MPPLADTLNLHTVEQAILFVPRNHGLILDKLGGTAHLSLEALGIALVATLPLGVILGHYRRGSFVAINASNVGRAMPTLGIVALGIPFLGITILNNAIALTILAGPLILTNSYVAVAGVDEDIVEAARGMGLSPLQVLMRVELPLALPLMFAGIRTASVYVIATSPIAAVAGGGGMGDIIVNQPTYKLHGVLGAALVIMIIAVGADYVVGILEYALTPAPMRRPIFRHRQRRAIDPLGPPPSTPHGGDDRQAPDAPAMAEQ